MSRISNAKNRRGAVAVEFALTAPLLFLLLFGAAELGHANMVFNVAEAAAYEAAREGIVPGATADECELAAQRVLDISSIRGAKIEIEPRNLKDASKSVQVSISVPYNKNTVVAPFFSKGLVIERTCSLTRERG